MNKLLSRIFAVFFVYGLLFSGTPDLVYAQNTGVERIQLYVEKAGDQSPVTLGIPFPVGKLHSPDKVRIVTASGNEVPSQITEVASWEPVDLSIKWVWVFFFADRESTYFLEYGDPISRRPYDGHTITVINNQRENGRIEVDTGTLRFRVNKRNASGFLDLVEVNSDGSPFLEEHRIAGNSGRRGSFMDLLDANGPDSSRAVIHQTFIEKGSGPLHSIIRIEGEYQYSRPDNVPAPFVTRIHAYAGKSYLRILHSMVYTGTPDMSKPLDGEHAAIATRKGPYVNEAERQSDPGLTQPNDHILALGLSLDVALDSNYIITTGMLEDPWWNSGEEVELSTPFGNNKGDRYALFQNGPKPNGIPPRPKSTPDERLEGFLATLSHGEESVSREAASGWVHLHDQNRGVAIGMQHFLEEYPKSFEVLGGENRVTGFLWSPEAGPMSFERANNRRDGDMVGNFATGIAKTSELVYYFYDRSEDASNVRQVMNMVLDPVAAHAEPEWYARTEVFGRFAPASEKFAGFERGLSHKFDWFLFNQVWEPWFGFFYYGDGMTNYYGNEWTMWALNEPAQDFMWWIQFMRTGEYHYFRQARNMSRHSMDVGNIHWPVKPVYHGDTNRSSDAFDDDYDFEPSPLVGMGRRHGAQPWTSVLSAHVWVQGWLAAYYLDGYHRGLDIAKLTADHYVLNPWGLHDLRGRRLYLAFQNLMAVYDATKSPVYWQEAERRKGLILELQKEQGDALHIDRYGYTQNYLSHALLHYYQLTGDEKVRLALIRHARRVRDVPPLDHDMESYLASIHSLVAGYQLSGEESFRSEAIKRAEQLTAAALPQIDFDTINQREYADLLELASNLAKFPEGGTHPFFGSRPIWSITNGLRVFGWTHMYNVPWLIPLLEQD